MHLRSLRHRALVIRAAGFGLAFLLVACVSKPPEERPSVEDISRQWPMAKPKYLCVFMDGTDNGYRSQTHVRRLFEIISVRRDPNIVCYYDPGVGAESNRIMGLITGRGFAKNVAEAYAFLGRNYEEGAQIYMFGFSRGARQVQVLADLIHRRGIPRCPKASVRNSCSEAADVLADYKKNWRETKKVMAETKTPALEPRISLNGRRPAEIEFIGIWDCVETLGSNLSEAFKTRRFKEAAYQDHEVYPYGLPPNVHRAFHAMALDERRGLYPVIKWRKDNEAGKLEQVWFPGSHGDVGGGYTHSESLAGLSLNWMMSKLPNEDLLPDGRFKVAARPDAYAVNSKEFKVPGKLLSHFKEDNHRGWDVWRDRTVVPETNVSEADDPTRPWVHVSVLDRISGGKVYEWPDFKCPHYYRPAVFMPKDCTEEAYKNDPDGQRIRQSVVSRVRVVEDKKRPPGT